jgi:hypothetical protein
MEGPKGLQKGFLNSVFRGRPVAGDQISQADRAVQMVPEDLLQGIVFTFFSALEQFLFCDIQGVPPL